jgi:hypothetical protein
MPVRRRRLACAALAFALAACRPPPEAGPVRTALEASEAAQRTLRAAGLDEQVLDVRPQDGAWLVTTRRRETAAAGHLVTVDAATGQARVERYRSVELGGAPP